MLKKKSLTKIKFILDFQLKVSFTNAFPGKFLFFEIQLANA